MAIDPLFSGSLSLTGISSAALAAFRQGREATREQNHLQAIKYYSDVLLFDNITDTFRARALEYRGLCHWLLSEFDDAKADYQASLEASDDLNQIARARVRLGELTDYRGGYTEAEPIYRQALQEATVAQNLLVIGRARRGLGIMNRRQGNTDKAITHLTQALQAFKQMGEAREQARVLTSLGRTQQARGEYQHALTAHAEALRIFESLNDRWRMVQVLNDVGESHQALYDIETALDYHERALALANECGAELLKPEIKRNLGIDLVEMNQMAQGLYYLQAALDGSREIGNREHEALALYHLARALLRESNIETAVQTVLTLKNVAEELDADRYRALAAFVNGELLFYQGNQAAAISELNMAMLAAQTSVDRGILWKLHATMSHVADNPEIAAVHRNIAAEFIRQTAEPLQNLVLKSKFIYSPPVMAILDAAGIDPEKL